jgi:hypothetical protein
MRFAKVRIVSWTIRDEYERLSYGRAVVAAYLKEYSMSSKGLGLFDSDYFLRRAARGVIANDGDEAVNRLIYAAFVQIMQPFDRAPSHSSSPCKLTLPMQQ